MWGKERNLSISGFEDNHVAATDEVSATVELAIVCDLDFVKLFKSYQEIVKYWEIYYWDVAMKFKSLPSSDVSIHVTGLVLVLDYESQPFIEMARSPNGSVSMRTVLLPFSKWISENTNNFPKFDLAMLVTNTAINDGYAGIAYDLG